METTANIDVTRERKEFLEDLKRKVQEAYKNRTIIKLTKTSKSPEDSLQESKSISEQIEKLPDDTEFELRNPEVLAPGRVAVYHSHDYKDLLKLSIQLLLDEGVAFNLDVEKIIDETLAHEFEHHVPALEHYKVEYCIEFNEDPEKQMIGFRPYIALIGRSYLGVYRDIISAPKNLSETDEATLNSK